MSVKYEFWYLDDLGNRLAYINDVVAFDYVKVLGGEGSLNLTIPSRGQLYDTAQRDRRIAVYRQPLGGTMALDWIGTVRDSDLVTSETGQYQRTIVAFDFNEILSRRKVAFYAGSPQSLKSSQAADDMMKEIVTENFIDNTDYSGTPSPTRSLSNIGLTVQADSTQGPVVDKGIAWRFVIEALQDIQADSKEQGAETFFGIEPLTENTMQFQTWLGKADRTVSTGTNPIVFSLEWGNLFTPRLSDISSDEQNFIYGTGEGKESNRIVQTAYNADAVNASVMNRREGTAWSGGKTPATVLNDAQDSVQRNRALQNFTGSIIDTPLTPYGGDGWGLGDKVTVNYAGSQWSVLIRAVHIQVQTNGDETIRARVEI